MLFNQNKKILKLVLTTAIAALFLVSCELVPLREADATITPPYLPPQPINQTRQSKINRLLDEAFIAFDESRLTTPIEDNAYYRYLQVLSLDSTNVVANQGIADIVEKYLEWAVNAANQQSYVKANNYLNKARSVDESHPSIKPVEKMIIGSSNVSHMTYNLSAEALNGRVRWLIDELHEIGEKAARQQARVVITARDDADGRWIYQQLNDATESRIRATFEPGQIPSVRLLYR